MKTILNNKNKKNELSEYDALVAEIMEWPKWKLRAMCVDESDVEIRRFFERKRANGGAN